MIFIFYFFICTLLGICYILMSLIPIKGYHIFPVHPKEGGCFVKTFFGGPVLYVTVMLCYDKEENMEVLNIKK